MLKTECAVLNGSKPHSYEEIFSKDKSFGDKIKATKNKIPVIKILMQICVIIKLYCSSQ
jgi:hypothetical protein